MTTTIDTSRVDLTPVNLHPHGTPQLVRCPRCGAHPGASCITANGTTPKSAHRARWDTASASAKGDVALFVAVEDPGHEGWAVGDHLLAQSYWLDPAKVTVLAVLDSEGRIVNDNPGWNAYRREMKPLRVLNRAEVARLGVQVQVPQTGYSIMGGLHR